MFFMAFIGFKVPPHVHACPPIWTFYNVCVYCSDRECLVPTWIYYLNHRFFWLSLDFCVVVCSHVQPMVSTLNSTSPYQTFNLRIPYRSFFPFTSSIQTDQFRRGFNLQLSSIHSFTTTTPPRCIRSLGFRVFHSNNPDLNFYLNFDFLGTWYPFVDFLYHRFVCIFQSIPFPSLHLGRSAT